MSNERINRNQEFKPASLKQDIKFGLGLSAISLVMATGTLVAGQELVKNSQTPEFIDRDQFTYNSDSNDNVCATAIELATANSYDPQQVVGECLLEEARLEKLKLPDGTNIAVEISEIPYSDQLDVAALPLSSPTKDS